MTYVPTTCPLHVHAQNKIAVRYAGGIPPLVQIFKPTLINNPEPDAELQHLLEMTAGNHKVIT